MIDAGIRIDASIDEDRYTDLLTLASWSKTVLELESVFDVRVVYEGAVCGFKKCRVICLVLGDADADVRLAIDAVPIVMTRPVLASVRAVVRALGAHMSSGRSLPSGVAVQILLVEPAYGEEMTVVGPKDFSLASMLMLRGSPLSPGVWATLTNSLDAFEPSIVLDLRDGHSSFRRGAVGLIVYANGQKTSSKWHDEERISIGVHEGQQIADEVRRGGFELLRLGDASADVVGLVELAPGVLSVASGPLHDRSLAEYAVDSFGALGVTAVAVGPTEWSRAAGVTLAAGAVLAVGSSIVHPGL